MFWSVDGRQRTVALQKHRNHLHAPWTRDLDQEWFDKQVS